MLCPFCLARVRFTQQQDNHRVTYRCPECHQRVPPMYVERYGKGPVVMNAIGFRGHGKTVYFSSLFYTFAQPELCQSWSGFYTMCLNEDSLETVNRNRDRLREGYLPDATAKNFPSPTIMHIGGIPNYGSRTLLFYDTGGEAFERASQITEYAKFVMRAHTAVFLVSIRDLQNPAEQMHHLLNTYIIGMTDLGGQTKDQNLLVVYTKADDLPEQYAGNCHPQATQGTWRGFNIQQYLEEGTLEALKELRAYENGMRQGSKQLRNFTLDTLRANNFVNLAEQSFRSVKFCAVSALGTRPMEDGRLQVAVEPRRILDPLLWLLAQR